MKGACKTLLGLAMVFTLVCVTVARAEEKEGKEVTLKGTITCAKCDLKKAKACHTVIKVKEAGKDVVYWFDTAGSKKYHKNICTEAKEGSVTGTVETKDGKKWITPSDVKFD